MNDVKLFKMGFGESIILGSDNDCLLVDCGSESNNKINYFDNVVKELKTYKNCDAMLSHFHTDHINGLIHIIKNEFQKFNCVYIPHVFTLSHPNFVDFEIIRYLLEQMMCPSDKTFSMWDLLSAIVMNSGKLILLKREDQFSSIDSEFKVLWPIPEELISQRLYNRINTIINAKMMSEIESLSDSINKYYLELSNKNELISYDILQDIPMELKTILEKFRDGFKEIIKKADLQALIRSLKCNANKASIVCHNIDECNGKNILLTGDIPSKIMKFIAEQRHDSNCQLHSHYKIIKAPHHGTDSHYFNFGCYTIFDKLLISNGETNFSKRGNISRQYNLLIRSYSIVCTNTFNHRCDCLIHCTACSNVGDVCSFVTPYACIFI